VFVILMLSTLAFDGVLSTPAWQDFNIALEPIWLPLGAAGFFFVRTVGLLLMTVTFMLVFVAFMQLVMYFGSRKVDLTAIRIDGLAGRIVVHPDGSTNFPEPKGRRSSAKPWSEELIDLAVGTYEITHGSIEYDGRHVPVNLRGRDLVSWVNDARQKVEQQVTLPAGYEVEWGGQFENFERAKKRLAMVVPLALAIIFGMLLWVFQDGRFAGAVFSVVPFALTGGILGLAIRGLAFSIPAAVGFIALAGVSVLNGVVLANEVIARLRGGWPVAEAIVEGSRRTMRAVLTTGAVAAFGFLPMALATGAGAEVQRPLATVVISGIAFSTLLTMFLLPGILGLVIAPSLKRASVPETEEVLARVVP